MSYPIADFIPLEVRQIVARQKYTLKPDDYAGPDDSWTEDERTHLADEQGYCPLGAALVIMYGSDLSRPDEAEVADLLIRDKVPPEIGALRLDLWPEDAQLEWHAICEAATAFITDWDHGEIKDLPAALGLDPE